MGKTTNKKKKPKKGSGPPPVGPTGRDLAFHGVILAAAVLASFFLQEEWRWISPQLVAACFVVGIFTGLTGNALVIFALTPAAGLLAGLPGLKLDLPPFLSYEAVSLPGYVAILSLAAGIVTLWEAQKKGVLRYEPVLVAPCLGLTGLAAAFWARRTAPLFNDLITAVFDNGTFLGLVLAGVLLLALYEWRNGAGAKTRNWIFAAAAGPIIGFWAGYADTNWPFLLVAMIIFLETSVLRERPAAIVAGMPLMAAPFWAARMFYPGAGSALDTARGLIEKSGGPQLAVSLLCFAAAHLLAFRLLRAVRPEVERAIFYSMTSIFIVYLIAVLGAGSLR